MGFVYALEVILSLALIFFLAWYIPKFLGKRSLAGEKGRYFTVIEKIPVSKDSSIMLVKMFDKVLVIGVTPGGMTTLGGVSAESLMTADREPEAAGFAGILKKMMENPAKNGALGRFMNPRKGENNEEK